MSTEREIPSPAPNPPFERASGPLKPEDFGLPTTLRLIERQSTNLFLAEIPIALLSREDVPIDELHVQNLARLMKEEAEHKQLGGQLQAGLVAQVIDEQGKCVLYLCDGFHRAEAKLRNGDETLYVALKIGCVKEDVFDLRIISATSHRPVAFSRIVAWVNEAWNLTPWSKQGITVGQAFMMAYEPKMTGGYIGLSSQEAKSVRDWAQTKCNYWGRPPREIYQHLLLSQKAAPDLVAATRFGRRKSSGHLTVAQLRGIAAALPLAYERQRSVAKAAVEKDLTEAQVRQLATQVAHASSNEEVNEILTGGKKPERIQSTTSIEFFPPALESLGIGSQKIVDRLWELELESAQLLATLTTREKRTSVSELQNQFRFRVSDSAKTTTSYVPKAEISEAAEELVQIINPLKGNEEDLGERLDELTQGVTAQAQMGEWRPMWTLFGRFIRPIISRSVVGLSDTNVEDIAQEVWVRILEARPSFELIHGFRSLLTYFQHCFRNYLIDQYRANGDITLLEYGSATEAESVPSQLDLSEEVLFRDEFIRLAILFGLESNLQRRVIIMLFYLELTNADVANCLGLNEGAVKSLRFRAVQRLKTVIEEWNSPAKIG